MPDPGPRKGEATRAALMEAARDLFAEKGFLRTHVADIVRRAGKSNGVFHIYFKNKEALLEAWLDECDRSVPWYKTETSLLFEKASRFVLEGYWALYERYGTVLEAMEAAALVSDTFKRHRAERLSAVDAGIARMIRHGQAEGRCLGIDPELTSVAIGAVISRTTAYWFAHRAELEARGVDREAVIDELLGVYDGMLGGREVREESGSFLEKRTKKLLP